jgi:hypothetical protein
MTEASLEDWLDIEPAVELSMRDFDATIRRETDPYWRAQLIAGRARAERHIREHFARELAAIEEWHRARRAAALSTACTTGEVLGKRGADGLGHDRMGSESAGQKPPSDRREHCPPCSARLLSALYRSTGLLGSEAHP